jgi:hypothetical protein
MQICFKDSRPVLDVHYDIERRVKRLLPRDLSKPENLVFCGTSPNGSNSIELRLEAAFDSHNTYVLEYKSGAVMAVNLRNTMERWTKGLEIVETTTSGSSDRLRQVIREAELARQPPPLDDPAAIHALQQEIISAFRRGELCSTQNKEGGTIIRVRDGSFIFQDYGDSEARRDFTSEAAFLAHLREFYAWMARYEWAPHPLPEIELWKFIQRQLRTR